MADSDSDLREVRAQLLVAEYQFVTGLIRYYRDVELRALGFAGLILTALAAAVAALQGGQDQDPKAVSTLLAIAAWTPAPLLLIVLMAKTRGVRAVIYVRRLIEPAANCIGGPPKVLRWEAESRSLFRSYTLPENSSRLRRACVESLITGTPIILSLFAMSVALAAAAIAGEHTPAAAVVGISGAFVTEVITALGLRFTRETDTGPEDGSATQPS